MKVTVREAQAFNIPKGMSTCVTVRLVGSGEIYSDDGELLAAGNFSGQKVRIPLSGDTITVIPDHQCVLGLDIPALRDMSAEWLNEPSYTDLSPKPFGQVSPEIQAVINQMNRNAIIREQAMLRALGHR